MKKIAFYLFWSFMCLHTSISFSDAASSGSIDDAFKEIDAIISESMLDDNITSNDANLKLNSAPIQGIYRDNNNPVVYTSWELIHRTPMMQGFMWTGSIANYITPAMYIGTPLRESLTHVDYDVTLSATTYSECVHIETDVSFGLDGGLMEETVEDELRNIAKYCAREYLGSYFEGKEYTTREEMLMLIFTMFDEDIELPGFFEDTEFIFTGPTTKTKYSNVSEKSWFAPYLSLAYTLSMIEDHGTWKTAREVTNDDIELMIKMYLLDIDGSIDQEQYGSFNILYDEFGLNIQKITETSMDMMLNSAPVEEPKKNNASKTTTNTTTTSTTSSPQTSTGDDDVIIAELLTPSNTLEDDILADLLSGLE